MVLSEADENDDQVDSNPIGKNRRTDETSENDERKGPQGGSGGRKGGMRGDRKHAKSVTRGEKWSRLGGG